jgi:integrase
MRVLTDEEVKVFLAAARRSRHYALFALAVATGMRRGELLGLHWPDVDFEAGTVTVRRTLVMVGQEFVLKEPKTKASRRTIAVPAFALDARHAHRKKMVARGFADRAVFRNCRGGFIRGYNLLRHSFQPILARAKLPRTRFHDLRHTHATALLSNGHPIKAVSQRLGHSDISITLRVYAHVLPADDARLAGPCKPCTPEIGSQSAPKPHFQRGPGGRQLFPVKPLRDRPAAARRGCCGRCSALPGRPARRRSSS